MSNCPSNNSPIDISAEKSSGACDQKCSFQYKYHSSGCVVTNQGNHLSIGYDPAAASPVRYNTMNYQVDEIRIYSPSIHSFRNRKADGEMVIVHKTNQGGNPLYVCIPFMRQNNVSNDATDILSTILTATSSTAPKAFENTTVSIDDFNLDYFIPSRKPFFSYNATSPFGDCVESVDFVVYTVQDSSVYISSANYKKLTKMISTPKYQIKTGPLLFYNKTGATFGNGSRSDEIYIDCKPVNKSKGTETVTVKKDTSSSSSSSSWNPNSWDDITENEYFVFFIQCLLFMFLITVFYFFIRFITGSINRKTILNSAT